MNPADMVAQYRTDRNDIGKNYENLIKKTRLSVSGHGRLT